MIPASSQVLPLPSDPAAPTQQRVFFPNLDGLRFLAFLSVFLFHSFYTASPDIKDNIIYKIPYTITRQGNLGVNFFFVLSGFLITYLLLSEKKLTNRISVGAFYMRRVLRIWPLYFVVVLIGFIAIPWLKLHFGETALHETAQPLYFVLFLANFNELYHGCQTPTLTLLWSVSVEEQFYLVWPLLVAVVPVRRLGWLFVAVIALSLAFRLGHLHDLDTLNLHTFSVIGDMAVGGLTAWLCFRDNRFVNQVRGWSKRTIYAGYALGVLLLLMRHWLLLLPNYVVFDRLVLSFFFAFVLLEQNYAQHSFTKMARWKFMSYWGTYTYGLYCLHYLALLVAIQLLHRLGMNNNPLGVVLGDNTVALLLALAMSWVSFNFYEKPFLKLKNRFAFITR